MAKSFAAHLCRACGGMISGRPDKRVVRAAFGIALPEDEESAEDPFHDATDFEPDEYAYADGGQVPRDVDLGKKRDVELPDYQLQVYRGENAAAKERQRLREEEAEDRSDKNYASADRYAEGGEARKPKLGSGKRFANLTRSIAQRGDVDDPKAVAAAIGRAKFGAKKFAALAAHGRNHAHGGEMGMPSFAETMARRMRTHRMFGGVR